MRGLEVDYTVVLQEDEEGNWLASVPAIPGCHTWGHTREEALASAKEAVEGCLESLATTGDAVPQELHQRGMLATGESGLRGAP